MEHSGCSNSVAISSTTCCFLLLGVMQKMLPTLKCYYIALGIPSSQSRVFLQEKKQCSKGKHLKSNTHFFFKASFEGVFKSNTFCLKNRLGVTAKDTDSRALLKKCEIRISRGVDG